MTSFPGFFVFCKGALFVLCGIFRMVMQRDFKDVLQQRARTGTQWRIMGRHPLAYARLVKNNVIAASGMLRQLRHQKTGRKDL